jgi:hypothetical protein
VITAETLVFDVRWFHLMAIVTLAIVVLAAQAISH